jgi:hypothetical protein
MKGTCIRCGKPTRNTDGIHIHTCTPPKALALAEMLERYNSGVMSQAIAEDYQAAATELRRLHEEAEELRYDREELRKIAEILEAQERFLGGWHSIVKQAFARIDGDEALFKQVLEVLETPIHEQPLGMKMSIIAAIKERLK